ncbi:GNAT family N-acetyltransferase [Desulfospira joergensenii]|uniref:GNAT family N-acetyltransferase n=1 Tax=Desulfospira joergensenii TaxID=53329 RepID=UPI0003B4B40A|nr:GNAT family N-acetyltransferase [Desulfospira joergensenii]
MDIQYLVNRPITEAQFAGLLQETTLGARRPLENHECIQGMLDHAGLLITAWSGDKLVGAARSVTDFHYCCYLSDLAVSESVQAQGIGKELIRRTFGALKPGCKIFLLSAPQAEAFYPKIGFTRHHSAWLMSGVEELR